MKDPRQEVRHANGNRATLGDKISVPPRAPGAVEEAIGRLKNIRSQLEESISSLRNALEQRTGSWPESGAPLPPPISGDAPLNARLDDVLRDVDLLALTVAELVARVHDL